MKKQLLLILTLPLVILAACGDDEEDKSPSFPKSKDAVVTVDANGNATGGHRFGTSTWDFQGS